MHFRTLSPILLCISLLFNGIVPFTEADGMWGTGTRRKRAAEREFTLPNHISSGAARTAKSFEELHNEAQGQEQVDARGDGFYADELLNSLHNTATHHHNRASNKKSHQDSPKKGNSGEKTKFSARERQSEVESFLFSALAKFDDVWRDPGFPSVAENVLMRVLAEQYGGAESERVRLLLQEHKVWEALVEAREELPALRALVPALAESITGALAPEDLRDLLALDLSTTEEGGLSPDLVLFLQRLVSEHGSGGGGGLAGWDRLQELLQQAGASRGPPLSHMYEGVLEKLKQAGGG